MQQLDVSNQVKNILPVANGGTGDSGAGGSGWVSANETWTFASADSPTYTFTVSGDVTGKYSRDMKVKFNQTLTSPLTSYWTFNSSNSQDSVGANNGTDTAITYSTVKFGNGAVFNGTTSKIVIADSSTLKPTGDYTIGFWIKTNVSAGVIFQSCSTNTNIAGITVQVSSTGKLQILTGDNTITTTTIGVSSITGNISIVDNILHHCVINVKNNYIQMYIDGKLDVLDYLLSPVYAGTNYIRIGCKNSTGTDTNFFTGSLDDIFFINGSTLDEQTIYNKYVSNTEQTNNSITITKFGVIVIPPTYSSPNTTITVNLGTDYYLTNTTITNNYYSWVKAPLNFPSNLNKWTILTKKNTNIVQNSPTSNTWYNLGGFSIGVPPGSWTLSYKVYMSAAHATIAANLNSTLSKNSALETNTDYTIQVYSGTTLTIGNTQATSVIFNSIKTTFYLNIQVLQTSITNITLYSGGGNPPPVLKAVLEF